MEQDQGLNKDSAPVERIQPIFNLESEISKLKNYLPLNELLKNFDIENIL